MNRLPLASEGTGTLQWSQFIERLFETAAPYLQVRGDWAHTRISHGYALTLLQHEGGNRHIVEPAVILHDVGWSALEPKDIYACLMAYFLSPILPNSDSLLGNLSAKKRLLVIRAACS